MQIIHQTKANKYFATYIDWAQGDRCLDWFGPEPDQGTTTQIMGYIMDLLVLDYFLLQELTMEYFPPVHH